MIISTTETVPNKEIMTILGIVKGSTVRAKHVGKDIFAGLKSIVGGEIEAYTDLLVEAREQAMNRMILEGTKIECGCNCECANDYLISDANIFRNIGLWNSSETFVKLKIINSS